MIYTYHIVKSTIRDTITVTPFKFFLDMLGLLFKDVVYLDEYNPGNKKQAVITFDDGYENFKKYAYPILKFFGYKFELFLVGDWVDKAGFLSKNDLKDIVCNKGRLEYHTKTHRILSEITNSSEIQTEIDVPANLRMLDENGFQYIAYPCWKYNEQTIRAVKEYGYKGALSGNGFGDNTNNFALNRIMMRG